MHESSKASIENYHKLVLSGEAQRKQDLIMAWILNHHKDLIITRHVIAYGARMPVQTVCGGVGRLIDDEYIIQDPDTILDPRTGNPSHRLRIVLPQPVQRTFTWTEK